MSSPAPATARPAGPRVHDGPRQPPGASTAAQPLLDWTPFPSAPGPGLASPRGLQEGSYQKGSPGSHSALRRAQAQDLESTRGPWGLRARKHRPVQPFVGQLQGTRCPSLEAKETGRDSNGGGLPHPTHTRAHLHQLLRSFLHLVIHAFSHRASAKRPGPGAPSVRRRGDSSVGVCEGHGNVHPAQLLEVNPGQ